MPASRHLPIPSGPRRSAMRVACGLAGSLLLGSLAVIGGSGAAQADIRPAPGEVAEAYDLSWLSPPSGMVMSSALGINDAGDVVGISRPTSSAQPQVTTVWSHQTAAPTVLSNLEGASFSRGFDINDDGLAVGEGFTSTGSSAPLTWQGGPAPHRITTLNASGGGVANDVNSHGLIAATAHNGTAVRAFTVDSDGDVATELPVPPGATTTRALAIADDGDVAGSAIVVEAHGDHSDTTTYAAVWQGGVPTVLPSIAEHAYATARGLNSAGVVVGEYQQGGVGTAVSWVGGVLTPLAPASTAGYPHTTAHAVSESGVVVGGASKFRGNSSFGGAAVAWDANGAVDLNTRVALPAGAELRAALDINDAGQIVGVANTADGARGFLLTPVAPAPPESLVIEGLKASYRVGDQVTLTARQTPATDYDHYHWFTRAPGSETWTILPTETDVHTETATAAMNGAAYQVRLYDARHTEIAASPPVVVVVEAPPAAGRQPTTLTVSTDGLRHGASGTATVVAAGTGTTSPSGQVSVTVDGRPLETRSLVGGRAMVKLPAALSAGTHQVGVTYPGDTTHAPASALRSVTVARAAAQVSLAVQRKAAGGDRTKLIARIKVAIPDSPVRPLGVVRVKVRGTVVEVLRLAASSPRTLRVVLPKITGRGTASVVASYAGSADVTSASARTKVKLRG